MSDEPHAAPPEPAATTQPEKREEGTDTSHGVTSTTDDPVPAAAAAPQEGPNTSDAGKACDSGSHETGTGASSVAREDDADGDVRRGSSAGGATASAPPAAASSNLLPGPFVAPSSYLRPVSTARAQSSGSGADANAAASGSLAGASGARQQEMAVRKSSNPVEREQIEGLVSLWPCVLFSSGKCVAERGGLSLAHDMYELWLTERCYT